MQSEIKKEGRRDSERKRERQTEAHQIHMYCHHCALNGYGYIKCLFLAAHWLQKKLLLSWYINQKPWNLLIHSKPLPPPVISPRLLFSLFIIFCFIEVIFIDQQVLLQWYLWASRNARLFPHTRTHRTHAHARTHARTHARMHAHTHTHTQFASIQQLALLSRIALMLQQDKTYILICHLFMFSKTLKSWTRSFSF